MKIKDDASSMNDEHTMSFSVIAEKGKAQQSVFNVDYLINVLKALEVLKASGFSEIIVTLEDDSPIIFGSRTSGIGIAPIVRSE